MSTIHTSTTSTAPFAVVRKGFDPQQVTATLTRLEAEAGLLRADRVAAVDRAERAATEAAGERARAASLEARVTELGRAPVTSEQMSERLATMLSLATSEAESIRDGALVTADRIRADAEEEAWKLRETARRDAAADRAAATAELTAARERAEAVRSEQTSIIHAARSRAEEIVSAAEREALRLDVEAAGRRDQIDEDLRLATDARRSESLREAHETQTAAATAADAVIRDAEESARRLLAKVETETAARIVRVREHTEELLLVRDQIVADLASIRARLEGVPGRLEQHRVEMPDEPGFNSTGG